MPKFPRLMSGATSIGAAKFQARGAPGRLPLSVFTCRGEPAARGKAEEGRFPRFAGLGANLRPGEKTTKRQGKKRQQREMEAGKQRRAEKSSEGKGGGKGGRGLDGRAGVFLGFRRFPTYPHLADAVNKGVGDGTKGGGRRIGKPGGI